MDDKTAISVLRELAETSASVRSLTEVDTTAFVHAIQAIEALGKVQAELSALKSRVADLESQVEDEVAMRDTVEASPAFDPEKVRALLSSIEHLAAADYVNSTSRWMAVQEAAATLADSEVKT
jgi:predicted DNA-binding transcriptional regulator YafY